MRRPEVGILVLVMLAGACAIPTDAPNWDMTWNIPVPDNNGMSIGVTSFLPAGVTAIGSPPTAFNAAVSATPSINRTLGAQCPACPSATAPKPVFTAPPSSTTVPLTAGANLTSATLSAGSQVVVALNNGFSFDPIRPPGGSPGQVSLTISNGAATLGQVVLDGGTSAIPPGQTTNVTILLAGTIVSASPITVTMTMFSPAGGLANFVTMNPAQVFTATATPTINISSATVNIAAQAVTSPPTPIDMSKIDSTIITRITNDAQTRGSMFLTITNPFTLGGTDTLTFSSPVGTPAAQVIVPISKGFVMTAASGATPNVSTVTINFTGIELRTLLGRNLNTTFSGKTAAGALTVTPAQKVSVTSRLQLNFNLKGQ